jgi:hypothetical protein
MTRDPDPLLWLAAGLFLGRWLSRYSPGPELQPESGALLLAARELDTREPEFV